MDASMHEIIDLSSDGDCCSCSSWSTDFSEKCSGNDNRDASRSIDVDDDCVIVEMKDDNNIPFVKSESFDDDVDELLIVHQKGELACRDYPHPRNLCANFPFSATPHQKHCNMCHCYVCDSPAPCIYWDSCLSSSNHCHANDEDEMWKIERTISREKSKNLIVQKDVQVEKSIRGSSDTQKMNEHSRVKKKFGQLVGDKLKKNPWKDA